MTKEELEREAEEYSNNLLFVYETDVVQRIVRERVKLALIDVLEPREKRIAELEAQIEKMKNCRNCKKFMIEGVCGHFLQVGWCKNWELRS